MTREAEIYCEEIKSLLCGLGFKTDIEDLWSNLPRPFISVEIQEYAKSFSVQLNCEAWKDEYDPSTLIPELQELKMAKDDKYPLRTLYLAIKYSMVNIG